MYGLHTVIQIRPFGGVVAHAVLALDEQHRHRQLTADNLAVVAGAIVIRKQLFMVLLSKNTLIELIRITIGV